MSKPLAIVTGGAGGIGTAIAKKLCAAGYHVAVADLRLEAAQQVANDLPSAVGVECDITSEESVQACLDTLGAVPEVLVNNAGTVGDIRPKSLLDTSLDDFRSVMNVNLTGTFIMSQAVGRRMVKAGVRGRIINIGSINGSYPSAGRGAYSPSKAGLRLFSEQMAIEWAEYGIRCNCVSPGFMDGGMAAPILADPAVKATREGFVPMKRLGQCEEVADAVAFFASEEESGYVTGQHLLLDGGVGMSIATKMPRPPSTTS